MTIQLMPYFDGATYRVEEVLDFEDSNTPRVRVKASALNSNAKYIVWLTGSSLINLTEVQTGFTFSAHPETMKRENEYNAPKLYTTAQSIANRLRNQGVRFFANDSIGEHLLVDELNQLQAELVPVFEQLLTGMVIDWQNDHNSEGTPKRLAKMFMQEIYAGRYEKQPIVTTFPNDKKMDELLVHGPMEVRSMCSHHHMPVVGHAWVGILPSAETQLPGLSKYSRLLQWVMRRPQIQEESAVQYVDLLEELVNPAGIALIIKASHMCETHRGVGEPCVTATTSIMRGKFRDNDALRSEFLKLIDLKA